MPSSLFTRLTSPTISIPSSDLDSPSHISLFHFFLPLSILPHIYFVVPPPFFLHTVSFLPPNTIYLRPPSSIRFFSPLTLPSLPRSLGSITLTFPDSKLNSNPTISFPSSSLLTIYSLYLKNIYILSHLAPSLPSSSSPLSKPSLNSLHLNHFSHLFVEIKADVFYFMTISFLINSAPHLSLHEVTSVPSSFRVSTLQFSPLYPQRS